MSNAHRLIALLVVCSWTAAAQFGQRLTGLTEPQIFVWLLVPSLMSPLAAALSSFLAARVSEGADRRAWCNFGVGSSLFFAGNLCYIFFALAGINPTFPALPELSYFLMAVSFTIGMFHYGAARHLISRIQLYNFGLILCAVAVSASFLLYRSVASSVLTPFGTAFAFVYPVLWASVAAFGLVCLLLYAHRGKRFPFTLLLFAALTEASADVLYATALMAGTYQVGGITFGLWTLSPTLVTWAAIEQIHLGRLSANLTTEELSIGRRRLAEASVPAAAVAAVLLSANVSAVAEHGAPLLYLLGPLAALFAVLIGLREHWALTVERRIREEITYLAHHDPLTGLANRIVFHDKVSQAIAFRARAATLFLDLDHFKEVNDTLGHPVGDALLRELADRLRKCVRATDTVGRLGGDEFAIIQPDLQTDADASDLAQRILEKIKSPYEIEGHLIRVGASIGIALAPANGADADQIFKNADIALYSAKAENRGSYRFFEPAMEERLQAKQTLIGELGAALASGQLEPAFQPIVDLHTNRVSGFEALLRWRHPVHGSIPPDVFIPIAEETGLIIPIGLWILRQACTEAATWSGGIRVAVNLSTRQFDSVDLAGSVASILADTRLSPSRLELEITETALLKDSESNLKTLHRLRELGVHIALDDFGTGYSSLGYLRRFPFSKIKIDRSFIKSLPEHGESQAIVAAVTGLGRALRIGITAEGVETRQQLDRVRSYQCDEAQGYFFSQAVPAHEISGLLDKLGSTEKFWGERTVRRPDAGYAILP